MTIEKKISLSNLFLIFSIIFISAAICLYMTLTFMQEDYDNLISNVAKTVSNMDVVKQAVKNKIDANKNKELNSTLDNIVNSMDNIDLLVVCDTEGVRYFHNDKHKIGDFFKGGDYFDILNGAKPYITENIGTLGRQRRAFYPIKDNDTIIGFVMSSVFLSRIESYRLKVIMIFLGLLFLFGLVGIVLSRFTTKYIRKLLFGYNLEEFRNLYLERNDVIDMIEDGIIAINKENKIILINKSAKEIFGVQKNDNNFDKISILFENHNKKNDTYTNFKTINKRKIIYSIIPIIDSKNSKGYTIILRDITKIDQLNEDLLGSKTTIDMLRTNNHEFLNKLHIILGYIESNNIELAKKYILKTTFVPKNIKNDVINMIPLKPLAALIIGKIMQAKELNINLNIKNDSFFTDKKTGLTSDEYVTIVGNLLENSIQSLMLFEGSYKNIEVGIYSDSDYTLIICDDNGPGIEKHILDNIYDKKVTTKGEGHGYGLHNVKNIIDSYNGKIGIETEINVGTHIEIYLPV